MKKDCKKLKDIIARLRDEEWHGTKVCYCYFNTPKCYQVKVSELTDEELNEEYWGREWWIEDNELCLMKGRQL